MIQEYSLLWWVINIPLGAFSVMAIFSAAAFVWEWVAKEEYGDEYRPWREIVTKIVVLLVVFLLIGVCCVLVKSCEFNPLKHGTDEWPDY